MKTQINLQDLVIMAEIIGATSQRGAIKPEEMPSVGALYQKLLSIIKEVSPPPADEASEPSPEPSPDVPSE